MVKEKFIYLLFILKYSVKLIRIIQSLRNNIYRALQLL